MVLGLGSDHAGYDLKVELIKYLKSKGFEINDFGPYSDDRADYPDFAHPVALAVENKEVDLGIIMCGSGNGINMAANKHQGIRSALCWEPEIAALARQHNDANICALPARFITVQKAKDIVDAYLENEFEGGRHAARVDKIAC
ncbi:MAG: ribose 5-phosphate isomerase B [Crocinitomicaceae bacterium]|mgnify:CR=1 FL=1|nr:ribose 5-phosphate isomerase B [Crocinitomicaceae bacterium]|tara:strand:- start:16210 stop:16638 length:429 start_codon:yes stop_codon:yes gene_type:complete